MTNNETFIAALFAQISNQTERALQLAADVEPVQEADARAIVANLLGWKPDIASKLLDALVNNAIAGMADNRCATAQDLLAVALGENPKKN